MSNGTPLGKPLQRRHYLIHPLPHHSRRECLVVRLTQDIDMTTPRGLQRALNVIREFDGPVALWASIPCTGGSPWQYVNECQYYRHQNIEPLKRLKGLFPENCFGGSFLLGGEKLVQKLLLSLKKSVFRPKTGFGAENCFFFQ